MKITVVTPSFNQGRFVGGCLASVREQYGTFAVEHIVLDNCSKDETAAELAAYEARPGAVNVQIFIEPDNGQTDAINRGFRHATGDVICWLNTDERYTAGALNLVADYFAKNPEVDVVFGGCDFVDTKGSIIRRKREYFYSESMLVFYGCYIPSCSTFVRRRVIDDGVLLDPEFKVTMDFDWYVRMAKAGYRFGHLPSILATFTWHETNISSTLVARRVQERRLVQDRHGGVMGPSWFRAAVYDVIRRYWQAVRVISRVVM